ncbi:hypothetical protein AAMO2058_001521300 [Amorphochlora amoebiformis]
MCISRTDIQGWTALRLTATQPALWPGRLRPHMLHSSLLRSNRLRKFPIPSKLRFCVEIRSIEGRANALQNALHSHQPCRAQIRRLCTAMEIKSNTRFTELLKKSNDDSQRMDEYRELIEVALRALRADDKKATDNVLTTIYEEFDLTNEMALAIARIAVGAGLHESADAALKRAPDRNAQFFYEQMSILESIRIKSVSFNMLEFQLQEMKALNIDLNNKIYENLILRHCEDDPTKVLPQALIYLKEMLNRNIVPSNTTIIHMFKLAERQNREPPQEVIEVSEHVVKSTSIKKLTPDILKIKILLGDLNQILELMAQLQEHVLDNRNHFILLRMYIQGILKKGEVDKVFQLVDSPLMLHLGIIRNQILSGLLEAGKLDEALEIFRRFVRQGALKGIVVVNFLKGIQEQDKPVDLVGEIVPMLKGQIEFRMGIVSKLFQFLQKNSNYENAFELYDYLANKMDVAVEPWALSGMLGTVLLSCSDYKKKQRAKEIMLQFFNEGISHKRFVSVLIELANSTFDIELLEDLKQYRDEDSDEIDRVESTLLRHLGDYQFDKADRIFNQKMKELNDSKTKKSVKYMETIATAYIKGLVTVKRYKTALEAAQRSLLRFQPNRRFIDAVLILLSKIDSKSMVPFLREMRNRDVRLHSENFITTMRAFDTNADKTLEIFHEAESYGIAITSLKCLRQVYAAALVRKREDVISLVRSRQPQNALFRELFIHLRKMEASGDTIMRVCKDCNLSVATLGRATQALLEMKDPVYKQILTMATTPAQVHYSHVPVAMEDPGILNNMTTYYCNHLPEEHKSRVIQLSEIVRNDKLKNRFVLDFSKIMEGRKLSEWFRSPEKESYHIDFFLHAAICNHSTPGEAISKITEMLEALPEGLDEKLEQELSEKFFMFFGRVGTYNALLNHQYDDIVHSEEIYKADAFLLKRLGKANIATLKMLSHERELSAVKDFSSSRFKVGRLLLVASGMRKYRLGSNEDVLESLDTEIRCLNQANKLIQESAFRHILFKRYFSYLKHCTMQELKGLERFLGVYQEMRSHFKFLDPQDMEKLLYYFKIVLESGTLDESYQLELEKAYEYEKSVFHGETAESETLSEVDIIAS